MSDALAQNKAGMTALTWASINGHEACVGLLLPASDVLARDDKGLTASGWAAHFGHESLPRFINAYALAQSEQAVLRVAVCGGAPRGRVTPRV